MNLRDRLVDAFEDVMANSTADQSDLIDLLEEIGRLNGGLVGPPIEDDEGYFVERVRHAMERQAIYYANALGGRRNADFLGDAYLRDLVEDGHEVEDRNLPLSAFVRLRDPDSVALRETPTAATYAQRFLDQGTTLAPGDGVDPILDELTAVRDRLRSHAVGTSLPARYANSFMVEGFRELSETARDQVVSFEPKSRDRVAVLYNDVYFESLLESLAAATSSISVLMFFFPYDGRRTGAVTTRVFNALIGAHERDAVVQVVLDRDREDQKYGTRHINANTIRALRRAGIDARFDSRDHVTHSKIITIDDRLTFIGAHNLSNSSSYLYEEASLLIRSAEVAEYYRTFIAEVT